MRFLTSFRSASIAGLLTLLAAGAQAADFPAPPPVFQAPPPAVDVGGGFYLRGDVGLGYQQYEGLDFRPPLAGSNTLSNSLESAFFIGGGVGYQWNSWLRTDLTGEYRSDAHFRIFEETTNPAGPGTPSGYNQLDGRVGGFVGLANAYIDLGTWHRITPFIGGGVGVAYLTTSGVRDSGFGAFAGGTGRAPDGNVTNFAWAIHAGLGYDLSANWKAEVGYRYLNLGDVSTSTVTCTIACPGFTGRIRSLDSHEIRASLRYVFADIGFAHPSHPGPLVRKY